MLRIIYYTTDFVAKIFSKGHNLSYQDCVRSPEHVSNDFFKVIALGGYISVGILTIFLVATMVAVLLIGTEMLTIDMLNHFITAEPKEVFVKFDTTQWTVEYKDTNYRITACKDVIYVVRKLK